MIFLRSMAYANAWRTRLSFHWSSRRLKPSVFDTGLGMRCQEQVLLRRVSG